VWDKQSAFKSGAQAFLAKPFDIEMLEATLASVL